MASATVLATYADNTTTEAAFLVPEWWTWPYPAGGDLVFPYYLTNTTVNWNRSNIFQATCWVDSSKELVSLTLPDVDAGTTDTKMHIFALSLWPMPETTSTTPVSQLQVQYARSTQKWVEGSNKTQIFEVTINNVGSEFVLRNQSVQVHVQSEGVETVAAGNLKRLAPGDQAVIEIAVVNKDGVAAGTSGNATVVFTGQGIEAESYTFNATFGIYEYEATYESVYAHESPDWYNNAKYGIFIHWGIYSVPGWGNKGAKEEYAEWYWYDLNEGPDGSVGTFWYDLHTYGPNVVYDDFIQNFTADKWDPKEWVDLFADAGANYFVQVSKHHDGYALFDLPDTVTKRTSVAQFPYRNLLEELFHAAKKYQPQLHRAAYFSLPEWFSPAYKKYGFGDWPGGNATNPFNNETLPYTGFVDVDDYITDVIVPEMQTLADMGTEIMWCDIGGPNRTTEVASAWFNAAAKENRQVVMNSRCGLPGDFDTPEYATYGGVQVRKWETNLGMDPYSYGYNRATPMSSYMNASTIVTSLVNVVSKNGNFLLDVGPMANGTILEVEQNHLREAGKWIKDHGEAIYNTTYWFVTPEEGDAIRFTKTEDAFYILALAQPNATITLNSPVPWVEGDNVTVIGGDAAGTVVPSHKLANGSLVLDMSDDVINGDHWTWAFKISY
ncbi:hypothetical protein ASPZODRAFT_68896 [Penicilliopsis zonata CBS 506.65]|uniref:alpha-L-fucosidase n=1 Tax=Penicilliopsis zonata CBS 506.65 TaxID=1073090 RepID=A0A1L9SFG4_9EURO|nr:hypothetical protein ASPZODRAFT_68896 [Penicilliopsis zonata CBS 506.65]OJJ45817.1 hypothetical protein ASPZODRAFT_68896 [Penicilliopsis zonata CBS 506.65]